MMHYFKLTYLLPALFFICYQAFGSSVSENIHMNETVYRGSFNTLKNMIKNTQAYNENEIVNDLLGGTSETESGSEKPNYRGSDDLIDSRNDGWASTSSESEGSKGEKESCLPSLFIKEETDEEDSSSSEGGDWRKGGGTLKINLSKHDENSCKWSPGYVHTEAEKYRFKENLDKMKLLPQLEGSKFLKLRQNKTSDLTVKLYGEWDELNSKNSSDSEQEDGSSSSSNKFIDPWELLGKNTELPFGNSSDSEEEKNSSSSSPNSFNYFI